MKIMLHLFMRKVVSKNLAYIIFNLEANQDMDRMIYEEQEIPLSYTGMFVING